MQPPVYDTPTKWANSWFPKRICRFHTYNIIAVPKCQGRQAGANCPLISARPRSNKEPGKTTYSGFPGLFSWWAIRGSNPGPTGYEPAALTN